MGSADATHDWTVWRAPLLALLAGCCLVFGTWQMGQGSWIYAKGLVAQWLLTRAWMRADSGEQVPRPWPWADTWPIARLEAPALGVDLIVLEGAHSRTLAFGPGHLSASPKPGESGTIILTGHRDTHFRFLRRLRLGDELLIRAPRETPHRYEIIDIDIVDSRTARIRSASDRSSLVLVTCYPFDAIRPGGPLRYVVTAVLKTGNGSWALGTGKWESERLEDRGKK